MKENVMTQKRLEKTKQFVTVAIFAIMYLATFAFVPSFAAADLGGLLNEMINIVKAIFVAVGIILLVYSIGQLTLAFKNEDADSKTRASTMLVVALVLIAFPGFIEALDLTQYLNDLLPS